MAPPECCQMGVLATSSWWYRTIMGVTLQLFHSCWDIACEYHVITKWANDLVGIPPPLPYAPANYVTWILAQCTHLKPDHNKPPSQGHPFPLTSSHDMNQSFCTSSYGHQLHLLCPSPHCPYIVGQLLLSPNITVFQY